MLTTRYDLPLDRDATSRFLPWIVAVMVFLAMLATATALVTSTLAERWRTGLSGTMTVQIAAEAGTDAAPLPERVAAVMDILSRTPGLSAEQVPARESARLLEPWLGSGAALDALPIPVLIDVHTTSTAAINADNLQAQLRTVAGVSVDDHQAWLADMLRLVHTFETVALTVVALVAGGAVLVVTFAARAGLLIHAPVIDLLHVMGATDQYIARQFQQHAFRLTVRGGLLGSVAAGLVLFGIYKVGASLESVLIPQFSLAPAQWGLMILVPLTAIVLSALTARLVVSQALSRTP